MTIGSDEIIPERDVTDQIIPGLYTVFIKADDGSWSGWTGSFGLQPRILANTTVVVHLLAKSGTMSLFPNKTSTKGEITLYSGATLQILAQEPRTSRLYAQVIGNSPDVGKKGWIWPLGLDLPKGNSPLLFAPPPK